MSERGPVAADALYARIGERLIMARLAHGLRQAEVGAWVGISFQQVQKHETAACTMKVDRLLAFAELFKVPPAFFFEDPVEAEPPTGPTFRHRELLAQSGQSGRDLAEAFGVSHQALSNVINGATQMSVEWLVRLAAVLGCHPWALVERDGKPPSREEEVLLQIGALAPDQRMRILDALRRPETTVIAPDKAGADSNEPVWPSVTRHTQF
jgi:transcriptional regulator with XRE-family HTH domain